MDWREVFKPTKGKLILSLILIILSLFTFFYTKDVMPELGTGLCKVAVLSEQLKVAVKNNDTAMLDRLREEADKERMRLNSGIFEGRLKVWTMYGLNLVFNKINPVYPVPCLPFSGYFCKYYISNQDFNCFFNFIHKGESVISDVLKHPPIDEYKPVSYFDFIIGLIFFVLEGYLVSVLVYFVYKKIRKN